MIHKSAESGVEALSLRGLARDLDVSHAAPRRHFADRRGLLVELAKEAFRLCVVMMEQGAEAAGPDPVARYRALGRSYVEFARRDPAFFRAMHHPEVRSIPNSELSELQGAWFATLRDGAAAARRGHGLGGRGARWGLLWVVLGGAVVVFLVDRILTKIVCCRLCRNMTTDVTVRAANRDLGDDAESETVHLNKSTDLMAVDV